MPSNVGKKVAKSGLISEKQRSEKIAKLKSEGIRQNLYFVRV